MAAKRKQPAAPPTVALPPPGRRHALPGERLFTGTTHAHRPHVWIKTMAANLGQEVVICGVCGVLQPGQTLPASWVPVTR